MREREKEQNIKYVFSCFFRTSVKLFIVHIIPRLGKSMNNFHSKNYDKFVCT